MSCHSTPDKESLPSYPVGQALLQVQEGRSKGPLEPPLLQAEEAQLSQPVLGEVLQASDQHQGLLWTCSSRSVCLSCWGPFLSSLLPSAPHCSTPRSSPLLDAWLWDFGKEEAKNFIQIFVSTKKVRAATSVVAVLVCPDRALALLPGSRSAAGWAELLPSVCLRQHRTSQHSGAVGSGSPPSRSPWFSLWLPG